ncbi:hypothetical protein ACQKWADRAFT_293028 [Trichoderma austrokoningii]
MDAQFQFHPVYNASEAPGYDRPRLLAGLQFARVTLKPPVTHIIRGASRCVTANRLSQQPSQLQQSRTMIRIEFLVPLSFLLGEVFFFSNATTTATPHPHLFPVSPWGGKSQSPSFASLIEMAVCSCVRRTGEKKGIKTLQTREKDRGIKNLTMFQPKGKFSMLGSGHRQKTTRHAQGRFPEELELTRPILPLLGRRSRRSCLNVTFVMAIARKSAISRPLPHTPLISRRHRLLSAQGVAIVKAKQPMAEANSAIARHPLLRYRCENLGEGPASLGGIPSPAFWGNCRKFGSRDKHVGEIEV